jgi:4-diphosphocytidyl-2-C-methyl-D-erythritol kinase
VTGAISFPAPGKVNLCLYVGPKRPSGLHELVTVVQPVSLADELTLEREVPGLEADEVVCPEVEGENLVTRALRAYRERCGWDGPPVRITIEKRVPIAGGMGGGSSDAACALQLAAIAAGQPYPNPCALEVAAGLGSDVPALAGARKGSTLVTGTGEEVERLGWRLRWSFVVVPLPAQLSAGEVYAEADRLALPRSAEDLAARRAEVAATLESGSLPLALMENDLQDAARSLCPAIDPALDAAGGVSEKAIVTGSGPTVVGVCRDDVAAHEAARALVPRFPATRAVFAQ